MLDKESIIFGTATKVMFQPMKVPIYDLEGNLLGHLVRQAKSVVYYFENQLGTRICEIKLEYKKGFASNIFIYDSLNQMRGYIIGGGSKDGWYKTTENPYKLNNASGQTIAISDSRIYERGLTPFLAAKGGITIRDSFGRIIVDIHGVNNHNGVQADFLDKNVDRLSILGFVAVMII
jgi:hypothetical protein